MSYMLGFLYSGYVCVAENYKSGQIIGKWGLFYATSKRVFPWPADVLCMNLYLMGTPLATALFPSIPTFLLPAI